MESEKPKDTMTLERLQGLMQGTIEPPNPYAAYIVEQLKQHTAELDACQRNAQALDQRLGQLRAEALRLEGRVGQLRQDLVTWDRKLEEPTAPAPVEA